MLIINNQEITTLEELKKRFMQSEAVKPDTTLFMEIIDKFVDGKIEEFLREIGEEELANIVHSVPAGDSDTEIMNQLIPMITTSKIQVDFDPMQYVEVIQSEIAGEHAILWVKVVRKATEKVDMCIKQGNNDKTTTIQLNQSVLNHVERCEMPIDRNGEDVLFFINNKKIKEAHPFPGLEVNVKDVCFTMRFVKGGPFKMGATQEQGEDASECERPDHEVCVKDFYICDTPVTQEQWMAIMGNNNPSRFKGCKRPVTNVTYQECLHFIEELNGCSEKKFRLPSEEEWEYAARGGTHRCKYRYSGDDRIDRVAWYHENGSHVTHDVARKKPNVLGIYDMSGNVWEWCSSDYTEYGEKKTKGSRHKITRGGCATSTQKGCRVSRRYKCVENHKSSYLGFRLVM